MTTPLSFAFSTYLMIFLSGANKFGSISIFLLLLKIIVSVFFIDNHVCFMARSNILFRDSCARFFSPGIKYHVHACHESGHVSLSSGRMAASFFKSTQVTSDRSSIHVFFVCTITDLFAVLVIVFVILPSPF